MTVLQETLRALSDQEAVRKSSADQCRTSPLTLALTSVLWLQPQRRAAPSPHGESELSQHRRCASSVDGDSSQPSTASSVRSRRDAALCLTTNQPSTSSARKNSLRRARGNTRVRRTNVSADLECGDFAGNERGATSHLVYLSELATMECETRREGRIKRLLTRSQLPPGKTRDSFDFTRLPLYLSRQMESLRDGSFQDRRENILIFGQPGSGKSHALTALSEQ